MSATEEWREIPGWPGYMASSAGRVRSHVVDPAGRLMSACINPQTRYSDVGPTKDGKQRKVPIHFLVALAFHGPRPDGAEVRHLDGTRNNNVPSNLAWGTHAENMADAVRHGTSKRPRLSLERGACVHGHPYSDQNTRLAADGLPRCRVCDREQLAARRLAKRLEIAPTRTGRAA